MRTNKKRTILGTFAFLVGEFMVCQAKPSFLKILHPEAFSPLCSLNHEPVVNSTGWWVSGLGRGACPPGPPAPAAQSHKVKACRITTGRHCRTCDTRSRLWDFSILSFYFQVTGFKNQKAKVSTFEKFSSCASVNFKLQVGDEHGSTELHQRAPPSPPTLKTRTRCSQPRRCALQAKTGGER